MPNEPNERSRVRVCVCMSLCLIQVPKGQGPAAAMQSFLTVMAMVWAGSQVTKVARAAGYVRLFSQIVITRFS